MVKNLATDKIYYSVNEKYCAKLYQAGLSSSPNSGRYFLVLRSYDLNSDAQNSIKKTEKDVIYLKSITLLKYSSKTDFQVILH